LLIVFISINTRSPEVPLSSSFTGFIINKKKSSQVATYLGGSSRTRFSIQMLSNWNLYCHIYANGIPKIQKTCLIWSQAFVINSVQEAITPRMCKNLKLLVGLNTSTNSGCLFSLLWGNTKPCSRWTPQICYHLTWLFLVYYKTSETRRQRYFWLSCITEVPLSSSFTGFIINKKKSSQVVTYLGGSSRTRFSIPSQQRE
jgi:hypothetical protein